MEWDNALYTQSLKMGKCEFCDNSYDTRPIFDHLLDVHRPNSGGQKIQSGTGSAGGSIPVRAHFRKPPRT